MSNEINKIASEITKTFFYLTERRATPATFAQTIGQAKMLLNAGFNKFEIIEGIKYCIAHPPKKGFNSLGWLSYTLEDILKKIKIQHIKKELSETQISIDNAEVDVNANKRKIENRGSDSNNKFGVQYDMSLFEEKE
jgi:hypothetical protein